MTQLEKLTVIANQLFQDEPQTLAAPIPWHAQRYTGGFYVCSPGCGKLFTDVASKNRHQAQYCREVKQ